MSLKLILRNVLKQEMISSEKNGTEVNYNENKEEQATSRRVRREFCSNVLFIQFSPPKNSESMSSSFAKVATTAGLHFQQKPLGLCLNFYKQIEKKLTKNKQETQIYVFLKLNS